VRLVYTQGFPLFQTKYRTQMVAFLQPGSVKDGESVGINCPDRGWLNTKPNDKMSEAAAGYLLQHTNLETR
jgi:hypothetical protein